MGQLIWRWQVWRVGEIRVEHVVGDQVLPQDGLQLNRCGSTAVQEGNLVSVQGYLEYLGHFCLLLQ